MWISSYLSQHGSEWFGRVKVKEIRCLTRMRICLDERMMKDILAHGRPTVKNLYSPKKTGFIPQIFSLNEKMAENIYRLDFPQN